MGISQAERLARGQGSPTDPRPTFETNLVRSAGQVVLGVRGEIDVATSDGFAAATEDALDAAAGRLAIDLTDTTFMGACGLTTILRAHAHLEASGGSLAVIAPSTTTQRLLDVTGVDQVVTVKTSIDLRRDEL